MRARTNHQPSKRREPTKIDEQVTPDEQVDVTDQSKIARGRWGEDLAARHYERLGYTVLDRNWRSSTGELDLVLEYRGTIVFSEVKARRTARFGLPAEAVGPDKQRRIRRLGLEWLAAHGVRRRNTRFDVVAITGTTIKLYEGAF